MSILVSMRHTNGLPDSVWLTLLQCSTGSFVVQDDRAKLKQHSSNCLANAQPEFTTATKNADGSDNVAIGYGWYIRRWPCGLETSSGEMW